jgi:site-specific recombinase XerD
MRNDFESSRSSLVISEHKEKLDRYQKEHIEKFFQYTQTQKSKSTLRAYRAGWKKFEGWCRQYGYDFINVSTSLRKSKEMLIGMFVSDLASQGVKLATIKCYLAGIKHQYGVMNIDVAIDHPEIKRAIVGIRRVHGAKQSPKDPITPEMLRMVIDDLGDSPIDHRDRALMLIGFAGAFRRSELVGIDIEHLSYEKDGVRVFIPKSKTDQLGQGRHVDIPTSDSETYCAVTALKNWISHASIVKGPVFVGIDKGSHLSCKRLGDRSVALVLKKRFKGLCNTANIAGHSLRSGHVTAAVRKGLHHSIIMKQTGHRSMETLQRYVRLNAEFEVNSAKGLI